MAYESVPDVEEGDSLPPSQVLIAKAQERYPEAGTNVEAEFLGRLDDAIDNCKAEIKLPRVSPNQLLPTSAETSPDQASFVKAISLPTLALGVSLATALLAIVMNSRLAQTIHPYFSCILTFVASIPEIRKRFIAQITPAFHKFQDTKTVLETKLDGVSDKGLRYLGVTETAMNQALKPINDKLAFVTKFESLLKKADPTIDIPDTSDIERSFDGYENQLKSGFQGMQNMVDLSKSLPAPFQSLFKFQLYVLVPFLAVMLGLQLYAVYQTTTTTNNHDKGMTDHGVDTDFVNRMLTYIQDDGAVDEWVKVFNQTVNQLNMTDYSDDSTTTSEEQWRLMWLSVQTYLATVLQIVIAFVVTQTRVIVGFLNSNIGIVEGKVNRQLKRAVGDVFTDIFQTGFGAVKAKFLSLVRKLDRVEVEARKLKDKIPGAGLMSGFRK